jgi:amyloid beta (A4) precursor protein-binding family A protein 1 (X11)
VEEPLQIGENMQLNSEKIDVQSALHDLRATLQRTKTLTNNINDAIVNADCIESNEPNESNIIPENSLNVSVIEPKWENKNNNLTSQSYSKESLNSSLTIGENQIKLVSCDEEEADTDLETDRLLGQQRLEELQGFDDNKVNVLHAHNFYF